MYKDYREFMEQYRALTDATTPEELVAEAQNNHRVQKLLVAYMLKDQEAFKQMLSLSKIEKFADKLVKHCKALVHDLAQNGTPEEKNLMLELNKVSGFLDEGRPNIHLQEWESTGYCNMFQRFLFRRGCGTGNHR